jgi:hypothetical protein
VLDYELPQQVLRLAGQLGPLKKFHSVKLSALQLGSKSLTACLVVA